MVTEEDAYGHCVRSPGHQVKRTNGETSDCYIAHGLRSIEDARLIAAAPVMLELLKLAKVRLFLLDAANAEAIDALLTSLGVINHG
jgi:hypothetical protein